MRASERPLRLNNVLTRETPEIGKAGFALICFVFFALIAIFGFLLRPVEAASFAVNSIMPSSGLTTGGQTVNIIGSNFAQPTPINFVFQNSVQTYTVPVSGNYRLETWGAQGGGSFGVRGGYSTGETFLTAGTVLYIHTGGQGTTAPNASIPNLTVINGGYNGGGNAHAHSTVAAENITIGGGGGASDVRVNNDNFYSRLIVAGGGGGGGYSATYALGVGGGLNGADGYGSNTSGYVRGMGGSQIAGGIPSGSTTATYMLVAPTPGSFGAGGVGAVPNGSNNTRGGGGGGGGWYGGSGGGTGIPDITRGGGGGSGWIYTASSFGYWQTNNPADANLYQLGSQHYLKNASTTAGNQAFLLPNGTTGTGNPGNGFVRITPLTTVMIGGSECINVIVLSSSLINCTTTAHAVGTADVVVSMNGESDTIIGGYRYHNKPVVTSISPSTGSITGGETVTITGTDFELSAAPIDFSYRNTLQTYTVPVTGYYRLETWGAQGGTANGGNGGYSTGIVQLAAGDVLNIRTGGAGTTGVAGGAPGGFNGGGLGGTNAAVGSGGGGSDMRLNSDSLNARIIVAGGGGGARTTTAPLGGPGGGVNGIAGGNGTGAQTGGGGGAQFGGGVGGVAGTATGNVGSFGLGGAGGSNAAYATGGGGGWYGGGSGAYGGAVGTTTGGGGGSGWVYTAAAYSFWQTNNSAAASQYLLGSQYQMIGAVTVAGNMGFPSPLSSLETGHPGTGYARITPITGILPKVYLGTAECTNVVIISPTSLTCTTSAHDPALVGVTVTSNGQTGTLPNAFLYGNQMVAMSIDPAWGYTAGGQTVTITGARFDKTDPIEFPYQSGVQTYTIPIPGYYKFEAWGAQGGTAVGGRGGYSVGTAALEAGDMIYIYTGGAGGTSGAAGTNGGGQGGSNAAIGGGGGSSDVRINTNSTNARVLVAGGGGGGRTSAPAGGPGGGVNGIAGTNGTGTSTGGGGGTQFGGGIAGTGSSANGNPGSFWAGGTGGSSGTATSQSYIPGGGGGWYGGGTGAYGGLAASTPGGGGGSGWVFTESTYNFWATNNSAAASQYLLGPQYYLSDAATVAGNQTFLSPAGAAQVGQGGNGYVRITPIPTVKIGGEYCTNIVIISSSQLTCTTAPHTAGVVDVVVTMNGEISTIVDGFEYKDPFIELLLDTNLVEITLEGDFVSPTGVFGYGSQVIGVRTNMYGYTLSISVVSNTDNRLAHATLDAHINPVPGTWPSRTYLQPGTWGFTLDIGPKSTDNIWAAVPLQGSSVVFRTSLVREEAMLGDLTEISYGTNIDITQLAGVYQATVVYTAVANL